MSVLVSTETDVIYVNDGSHPDVFAKHPDDLIRDMDGDPGQPDDGFGNGISISGRGHVLIYAGCDFVSAGDVEEARLLCSRIAAAIDKWDELQCAQPDGGLR